MSWIVAGIALVGSVASSSKANKADREANELLKYQDLIDVERFGAEVALEEYNMRRDLNSLESEQYAMASAMGKRTDSAGLQRTQEVGRKDTEDNIQRMNDEVSRAKKYGKVTADARDRATSSKTSQRNINTATSGLLSFSNAFA